MEESIVFRPDIPDRDVDREVRKVDQQLQDAGTINPEIGDVRGDVDLGGMGGGGGLRGSGPGSPLRSLSGGMQDLVPMADYRNRLLEDLLDGIGGARGGGGGPLGGLVGRIRELLGGLGVPALSGILGGVTASSLIGGSTIPLTSLVAGVGSVGALIYGVASLGDLVDGDTSSWNLPARFGKALGEGFQNAWPNMARQIRSVFTSQFNLFYRLGQRVANKMNSDGDTSGAVADQTDTTLPDQTQPVAQSPFTGTTTPVRGGGSRGTDPTGNPFTGTNEPIRGGGSPTVTVNQTFNVDGQTTDMEREIDRKMDEAKREAKREIERNLSSGGRRGRP